MPPRLATLACCVTLVSSLAAQESPAPRPRIIKTIQVASDAMASVRTYGLLLPPDYDTATRRYPVVYLLHGSGQRHVTWGRRTLLDGATNAIVVMPDMDRARYVIGDRVDAQAETFLTQELIAEIDTRYRTIASREGRSIAGLSIGGFGAMLLGLRHADLYSAVGSFSAPLDGVGDPAALLATAPRPLLYVGCGVADSLLPASRRFAARLEQKGIARTYEEGPGAHTWDAWDWQLRSFLLLVKAG